MTFLKGKFRYILIATLVVIATSLAWSDSLQLRDGRHFDGQYVGGTQSTVAFFTNGSVQYFGVQDVLLVVFGGGSNTDSMGPLGQQSPMMKPMSNHRNKGSAQSKAKKSSGDRKSAQLLRTKESL